MPIGRKKARRHFVRLALAGGLLALGACTAPPAIPTAIPTASVRVAPHLIVALPRPSDFGRDLRLVQLVTAKYGERRFTFEGHIQLEANRLLLTCVDPLGRVAMTVTWTEHDIIAKKEPFVPPDLLPENILADIVLLYWPEPVVRQALKASAPDIVLTPRLRSISQDGHEIIRAEYQVAQGAPLWTGNAIYRNLVWGYSLNIQSREIAP